MARKIAFNGWIDEPANDQIFTVDAATGGGVVQLTSCPAAHPECFNSYPAWSPDGTKIAFSHADGFDADDNPANEQIYVMNADGSNPHALTTGPGFKDQVADWSPDGSKISFTIGYVGGGGIWTMNADGSHARQLTGCALTDPTPCPGGDDWGTAWSPDGRKIVFLRDLTSLGIDRSAGHRDECRRDRRTLHQHAGSPRGPDLAAARRPVGRLSAHANPATARRPPRAASRAPRDEPTWQWRARTWFGVRCAATMTRSPCSSASPRTGCTRWPA